MRRPPKQTPKTKTNPKWTTGPWEKSIDVRDFIQKNYTPYKEDESFLKGPTKRTTELWNKLEKLIQKEIKKGGVLNIDTKTPSQITSHAPGYIAKGKEKIVGLQTEKPLTRTMKPNGGVRLVRRACESYGYKMSDKVWEIFNTYRKTHNDGVYDVYKNWDNFYTPEVVKIRKTGVITGLPDNYGRGRIIGDYRRLALYGTEKLIADKKIHLNEACTKMDETNIRLREEVAEQIKALHEIEHMAKGYGYDVTRPAENFHEAVQWTYFAYLAAVKEQDGAAMSFGRIDAFFDIYAERDLADGKITESKVQEIIDDFVMKLRIVRHLRAPEYNELFAGDPTWVTCLIGGIGKNRKTLVTKTTFRILQTLKNLGPAPEPNITVAWSPKLPEKFKKFAARIAATTCAIQFENDDLMRPLFGDDYAIACCVSAATVGKQMEFFGARCNVAKLLLLAINEGRDEFDGSKIVDGVPKLKNYKVLDYKEVKKEYYKLMKWLAKEYVDIMNIIHYMHDKYSYEASQMALIDTLVERFMAFGIAGFSVAVDSLSAIKHAKVTAKRDRKGIAKEFKIDGEYPAFGNDDDRVDKIAIELVKEFIKCLEAHETYRNSKHTLSILTITANVVYGHHTGATPDGRPAESPFAPGANPMHGRDKNGAIASLNSVAKIPYESCLDGISNTFSIAPQSLGKNEDMRVNNLKALLDGYFTKGAHHLNVNVINQDTLRDAMKNPSKYPQLTIRVSGYAVRFIALNKEQQEEVIARTFHKNL